MLSTSFNVTLTSPAPGGPILLAPTLAAGASATQTVVVTSAVVVFVPVYAAVSAATGAPALTLLSDLAIAGRARISLLLQAFDVTAAPGFVDFGTSSTRLSARIANVGNWRLSALATLTVIGPNGGTSATLSAPVTLAAGNPTAVDFGSLNTSGFQTGTYTITVSAMVTAPAGLAGFVSSDSGLFSVGQALERDRPDRPACSCAGQCDRNCLDHDVCESRRKHSASADGRKTARRGSRFAARRPETGRG